MRSFLNSIRLDYLQRTRNNNFLITLCASLAIAYTFVPEPNANYSTIRISNYVGYYNAAWFGYVTAIMTSIFLSLIGFYLINGGLKNDADTKVGQIIASTSVSNFRYLLSKMMSNFLLLLTIVFVIFLMSILLFFLYNDGYSFQFLPFVKPYLIITIPTLFFIACLAVIFEVLLNRYRVLQNMAFFFLFSFLAFSYTKEQTNFSFDALGTKIVIYELEQEVKSIKNTDKAVSMNIGYVIGNTSKTKKFEFNGISFPTNFIISRVLWMLFGFALVAISSLLFHRFSGKTRKFLSKPVHKSLENKLKTELNLNNLTPTVTNYSIFPLIKTEFLMLFRKGKKWLWLVNISGMVLLFVLPLTTAHQIVLPILWFLQVHRISDITTKEYACNVEMFVNSSYKPFQRTFVSKIMAALLLMTAISLPLMSRYMLDLDIFNILAICSGFSLLITISISFGLIFKGKKLFEVVFFLITYANINGIPYVDYFGGFDTNLTKLSSVLLLILILLISSIFLKRRQLH